MTQPDNSPPAKDDGTLTKSKAITGILFFISLILACVLAFGDIWPVSKLEELQQEWFGGYYVKLTFLLTLLIVFLPVLGVQKLIEKTIRKKDH